MSQPPLNNPNARYWDDLVQEFDFSPEEQDVIRSGAGQMIAEVRAQRLAELRSACAAASTARCTSSMSRRKHLDC
jgi:hypothetical protein